VGRARGYLRQAEEAWRDRQAARAVTRALIGVILAPGVAFYVGVYPHLRDKATGIWRKGLERLAHRRPLPPPTAVYLDRTECWNDGWVGPRLLVDLETALPARAVGVKGWVDVRYLRHPLVLTVRVDHQVIGRHRIVRAGDFIAHIPFPDPLPSGVHTLEVEASAWFVPHLFTGNGDYRPLSWRMGDIELEVAP
jgi:hypothetical protein